MHDAATKTHVAAQCVALRRSTPRLQRSPTRCIDATRCRHVATHRVDRVDEVDFGEGEDVERGGERQVGVEQDLAQERRRLDPVEQPIE
jgi:hypothetical protein